MVEYTTVTVTKETSEQLDFLSDSIGKPKTQILSEIIEEIVGILGSMKPSRGCKKVNMQLDSSVLSQTITIQLLGRSTIIAGHFPSDESDKVVDAKVKEKIGEAIKNG